MEIVYSKEIPADFRNGKIVGFYGDLLDLNLYDIDTYGINYDDEWKVSKFLNGGPLSHSIDFCLNLLVSHLWSLRTRIDKSLN